MPPEAEATLASQTPPPSPLGNDPTVRTESGTIKDPATESKPASETSTESTAKPAEPKAEETKAAPSAPEKYEAFKAPEGFELDAKAVESASALFKKMNLSQDQAQELVSFYAEHMKQAAEAPTEFYTKMRNDWRTEIAKDATLGNGTDNLSG